MQMNINSSISSANLEPEAQVNGNADPPPTTTMPAVEAPADSPSSASDKMSQANKDTTTKGPVVKIKAMRRSEYVTTTVIRGMPAASADMYYLFLRRQLKCTGYHHEDGKIELFRVSCKSVKACLERLRFSEKDLDFQVVN